MIEPVDDDRAAAPTVDGRPTDPGIAYRVEEWAAEFGDDDPARTLAAVTHLWWSSHLEPGDVSNAMKVASHATRKLVRQGRLHRPPMAYAMTVLHTELSMRCVAQGLPPLSGGPASEQLGARQLRAHVERIRGDLATLKPDDQVDAVRQVDAVARPKRGRRPPVDERQQSERAEKAPSRVAGAA